MKQITFTTGFMLSALFFLGAGVAQAQCDQCGGGEIVSSSRLRGGHIGSRSLRSGLGNIVGAAATKTLAASVGLTGVRGGTTVDADGRVQPQIQRINNPKATLALAARDAFSPNPIYAYSNPGLQAGHVHAWNQQQASVNSWHGGYNTWRYGQPTAVVVPPTASYQSSYSWGVGQTRSTPIHHQFGRGAGSYGGVGGGYQNAPYSPWSTNQFGYYPVRANW